MIGRIKKGPMAHADANDETLVAIMQSIHCKRTGAHARFWNVEVGRTVMGASFAVVPELLQHSFIPINKVP
jgi:hypothetical protein